MNKLVTVLAFGIVSSVSSFALADTATPQSTLDYTYRCLLTSARDTGVEWNNGLKCWVEGSYCENSTDNALVQRCNQDRDGIRIKCNNGFTLDDRDASDDIEGGTLWINAEQHSSIATLRVDDFVRAIHSGHDDFRIGADLMFSKVQNQAYRIDGRCEFKKRDHN